MREDLAATSSRPVGGPARWAASSAHLLRMYGRLMRLSLAAQRQYAVDFAAGFVVAALTSASEIVVFAVILSRFRSIGGWGVWQVALLYGLSMGSYTLHRLGAGDLHSLSQYVRNGEFDQLLLRPWSPLLALLLRSGRVGQIANAVVPLGTLVVAVAHLEAAGALPGGGVALLALTLLAGTAVQYAVAIATQAAAFWITQADELEVLTIHAPNTAAEYPLAAYPAWLRGYLVSLVPVGLTVYYPARALLGRGGGWEALAAAPAAAGAALALALWVWGVGQRRYQGTGT